MSPCYLTFSDRWCCRTKELGVFPTHRNWQYPLLVPYWKSVIFHVNFIFNTWIPLSPKSCLLGLSPPGFSKGAKRLSHILTTAICLIALEILKKTLSHHSLIELYTRIRDLKLMRNLGTHCHDTLEQF